MYTTALGTIGLCVALMAPPATTPSTPTFTHGSNALLAPCTTFCLAGANGPVFGRNYDWDIGVANVTVNKRGLAKTALVPPSANPAKWTSKYGSITFNQYGREFPSGGMNEAGLVVEVMWLTDTRFPEPDDRQGLRELAWIQYQLDNCKSVSEVIATDEKIRVTPESISTHFLVCDRSGAQATIEFLDGETVVHRGGKLPIPALTNSPYSSSMKYLETFAGFGGDRPTPRSESSLDRFVRAACGVVDFEPSSAQETIDYAFGILADVSQGTYTKWSMVYDIEALTIHFKTSAAPTVKTLKLAQFDFSPATPCRILDIDTRSPGDPAALFVDYTTEANKKLVQESWRNTEFLQDKTEARLNEVATYPESIVAATEGESRQ